MIRLPAPLALKKQGWFRRKEERAKKGKVEPTVLGDYVAL
jgi:stalled ribosome alternative rescue factor ArfA